MLQGWAHVLSLHVNPEPLSPRTSQGAHLLACPHQNTHSAPLLLEALLSLEHNQPRCQPRLGQPNTAQGCVQLMQPPPHPPQARGRGQHVIKPSAYRPTAARTALAWSINRCHFLYLVLAWLRTRTLPVLSYLTRPKKRLAFACPLDDIPGQDLANPGCCISHTPAHPKSASFHLASLAWWWTFLGPSFYTSKKQLPGGQEHKMKEGP